MIIVFNSREIIEELENKKARKKSKKTFYSDLSRNIAVSLGIGTQIDISWIRYIKYHTGV